MANGDEETAILQRGSSSSSSPRNTTTSSRVRAKARNDPILIVCRCFSFITAMTAILCIVVNVFSAIQSFKNESNIFNGIFRCYAVLFATFVAVIETEWQFILKFWKVLEYWVGRGMLQIFVAVMTRAFPDITNEGASLVVLQNVASFMLLGCGAVYIISGLLCLGFLKRSRQKKEITTEQAVKDLQELERRREELQAMLLEENVQDNQ